MSSHERRQHVRHPASYQIEVTHQQRDADTKSEKLHDISDRGVSFNTNVANEYQVGQRLEIGFTPSNQESSTISLQGTATVMWIQHDTFSLQSATIGVHFDSLIESEKMVDL